MKKLIKKLNYSFLNKELLKQALTRTSALNESLPQAAANDFQTLELIGDAALKHNLSIILLKTGRYPTVESLHQALEPLIKNDGAMVSIANSLQLRDFIIAGSRESKAITDKMLVDTLEAIIGAISLDSIETKNGSKTMLKIISELWQPHLGVTPSPQQLSRSTATTPNIQSITAALRATSIERIRPTATLATSTATTATSAKIISTSSTNHDAGPSKAILNLNPTTPSQPPQVAPLSPRTQKLIDVCSHLPGTNEEFAQAVKAAPHAINTLFYKKKETPLKRLVRTNGAITKAAKVNKLEERITILTAAGASWNVDGQKETTLAALERNHPTLAAKYRR